MIKQYVTLIDTAPDGLDKRVNEYLEEGWELYGSPYMCDGKFKPFFCQAVVKRIYK